MKPGTILFHSQLYGKVKRRFWQTLNDSGYLFQWMIELYTTIQPRHPGQSHFKSKPFPVPPITMTNERNYEVWSAAPWEPVS